MADKIEIQLPNGEWEERTAETISEKEEYYPMRCCGKNKKGDLCHAPMGPVHLTKPCPHITFRQKNNERVHILNCEYDERRESEISTHLDYRALGSTSEDIWKSMRKKQKRNNVKGKKPVDPDGGSGGDGETTGGAEPAPRPIRRKSVLPTSPEALTALLLDLPIDAPYANTYVRDLIIDRRTVDSYRANGIPQDKYVLVLAKRLASTNRTFSAKKGEIVLVDCNYDASSNAMPKSCIQFRMSLYGKVKEDMFKYLKLKGDNTYITIFCKWEKDSENKNTYFAKNIDADHIGRVRLAE